MPAARYWRVIGVETYGGGDLELYELALFSDTTRVDTTATLTSSVAPTAGALSNLNDSSNTTVVRFSADSIKRPLFEIQWDFGVATALNLVQPTCVTQYTALLRLTLQYFDGTEWRGLSGPRFSYTGVPLVLDTTSTDADFNSVIYLINSDTFAQDNSKFRRITTSTSGVELWSNYKYFGSFSFNIPPLNSITAECDDILAGDFTVEAFAAPGNNVGTEAIIGLANSSWALTFEWDSGPFRYKISVRDGTGAIVASSGSSIAPLAWVHAAWTRQSGTNRLFLNGALSFTWTNNTSIQINGIRTYPVTTGGPFLLLDSARITKGIARYTAAFSIPTSIFPGYQWDTPNRFTKSANSTVAVTSLGAPLSTTFSQLLSRPELIYNYQIGATTGQMATNTSSQNSSSVGTTTGQMPADPTQANSSTIAATIAAVAALPSSQNSGLIGNTGLVYNAAPQLLDLKYGGPGYILGSVKEEATPLDLPLSRRVRLYCGSRLVRETWSDPVTGAFIFTELTKKETYTAIAYDYQYNYRALITEKLSAV